MVKDLRKGAVARMALTVVAHGGHVNRVQLRPQRTASDIDVKGNKKCSCKFKAHLALLVAIDRVTYLRRAGKRGGEAVKITGLSLNSFTCVQKCKMKPKKKNKQ